MSASLQKKLQATSKKSLLALKEEQETIEGQIMALIKDDQLKELFELIVFVPGVSPTTATELLFATNEMQRIHDAKRWLRRRSLSRRCCPFVYSSGTNIRGDSCKQSSSKRSAGCPVESFVPPGAMSAI
ncbi:hypothetical protein C5O19_18660 [Siphonobacter curvatus]|uniref:Uncharacterized protein n=1 Tax=Siphonobacter curvatus TaxID=2094562 RepID=A0A2S7IIY8_9BACT|nr:hypothetical protein C5O19_18660 [Siphonobacter curvatus]